MIDAASAARDPRVAPRDALVAMNFIEFGKFCVFVGEQARAAGADGDFEGHARAIKGAIHQQRPENRVEAATLAYRYLVLLGFDMPRNSRATPVYVDDRTGDAARVLSTYLDEYIDDLQHGRFR